MYFLECDEDLEEKYKDYRFIEDFDGNRKGFFVK